MNKQFLIFIALIALATQVTKAGIYILGEPSADAITGIVTECQSMLADSIKKINEEEESHYLFQSTQFSPHISLAFVSQEELSVEKVKEKYPALTSELQEIAAQYVTTDLTESFKNATLDYWSGRFEVECGGSKKKNYLNVVLKACENQTLSKLATHITQKLKEQYGIEQRFPFSAHFTIGRICEQKDGAVEQLKEKLLSQKITHKEIIASIVLDTFKLKGHDGSEEIFALANIDGQ